MRGDKGAPSADFTESGLITEEHENIKGPGGGFVLFCVGRGGEGNGRTTRSGCLESRRISDFGDSWRLCSICISLLFYFFFRLKYYRAPSACRMPMSSAWRHSGGTTSIQSVHSGALRKTRAFMKWWRTRR